MTTKIFRPTFRVTGYVHTFYETRFINGYEETTALDIHRVKTCGVNFFTCTQRHGDVMAARQLIRDNGVQCDTTKALAGVVTAWRQAFHIGVEVPLTRGHYDKDFSDAIQRCIKGKLYRIVIRTIDGDKIVRYVNHGRESGIELRLNSSSATRFLAVEQAQLIQLDLHSEYINVKEYFAARQLREDYPGEVVTVTQVLEGDVWVDVTKRHLTRTIGFISEQDNLIKQF